MASGAARYDGHSQWYDRHFEPGHRPAEELAFLREALGAGHGQVCVDRLQFLSGYGSEGWANRASGDGTGLGGRVGFHHKTLASFLGAIVRSGLNIRDVREFASNGIVLPRNIGLVAEQPEQPEQPEQA